MRQGRKGFTLIEITIVLAIASLVIALVFMALGGAQRDSRDTARQTDTQKVATAIEQWAANHNGELPSAVNDDIFSQSAPDSLFSTGYLDVNDMKDPKNGTTYGMYARQAPASPPVISQANAGSTYNIWWGWVGHIYYVKDYPSQGKFSVFTNLERGGYDFTP